MTSALVYPQNKRSGRGQLSVDTQRVKLMPVAMFEIPSLRLSYAPHFGTVLRDICQRRHIDIIHNHGPLDA